MRLFKTLMAVAVGAVLSASGAIAETPKNTLVIADAIDDIITLDPAEVSEVGGVLASQHLVGAIEEMLAHDGPYVLDVATPYQEHVLPMIPGGMTVKDIIKE